MRPVIAPMSDSHVGAMFIVPVCHFTRFYFTISLYTLIKEKYKADLTEWKGFTFIEPNTDDCNQAYKRKD